MHEMINVEIIAIPSNFAIAPAALALNFARNISLEHKINTYENIVRNEIGNLTNL